MPGVGEYVMTLLKDNDIHCHTYINDVERSDTTVFMW